MPPIELDAKYAVFISGVQVMTTEDVTINASLSSLCRVAEFQLAEQPATEPEEDDEVLIMWLDYTTETSYEVFGGTIDFIEVESDPWTYIIRCTDQLDKLRRVPSGDRSFTGQTVTESMQEILDTCGVDYDVGDLVSISYELGQEVPVAWHAGIPGTQVAEEINSVFGLSLQTIGNDRVIWFRPDLPPADSTGQYRSFTRGVDADWSSHRRNRGGRSRIQSHWSVTGASIPCGSEDACQCTPWANAIAASPRSGGRRVRYAPQTVSSDLIQDESVAEEVVRRNMGLTNRSPDEATVSAIYDPNMHPGTKVGLVDSTYGINATTVRRCTAIAVDATGPTMTMSLVCGEPGSAGTVTTGVEKVCNDVHTGIDIPGSFTPPDFDFPEFDPGLDFDLPDFFDFDSPLTMIDFDSGIQPLSREWTCGFSDLRSAVDWTVTEGTLTEGVG